MERKTISEIRKAVHTGKIPVLFTPGQVNVALGITWAGTFLPKHRVGNPAGNTELFIRVRSGLYQLKTSTREQHINGES